MTSITNPQVFRENIQKKLTDVLLICGDANAAINLEKGIYNYAIKEATQRKIVKKWENPFFVQIYKDRLRSIYLNLKNAELLEQVRSGEITPQSLAFMTHQELQPKQWDELIQRKIKRDASKYVDNTQASTDMFTCKKCRSKRCTYYELQTRSADEPATIFVTCLDCGKHWKS
jgi:transcription elongation factor S-II